MVDGEDERHYIAWFQKPGVDEAKLDADVRLLSRR